MAHPYLYLHRFDRKDSGGPMSPTQHSQHKAHLERDHGRNRERIIDLTIPPNEFARSNSTTIRSKVGVIQLRMCTECGLITSAACQHSFADGDTAMRWNNDETQLRCVICGVDGT